MLKEKQQQRKEEINQWIREWSVILGLDKQWDFQIEYTKLEGTTAAQVDVDHPYKRAVIRFSNKQIFFCDTAFAKRVVVHELVHVLFDEIEGPMGTWFGGGELGKALHPHIESLVDVLTNLLVGLVEKR